MGDNMSSSSSSSDYDYRDQESESSVDCSRLMNRSRDYTEYRTGSNKDDDQARRADGSKSASLMSLKLIAVQEGRSTDVKFLVGSDDNPELMHAFKSDLTLASDVFRSMLDGPFIEGDQEVVRIKDTNPWNFKNLLVAIHTYADETRLDHLELSDYVELGLLADKFLVQQVVNMCFEAIKSNVSSHTVWDTLNRLVLCPQLSKACDKYLSCNTKKCLERKSTFNCVSEEAFVHFLKLEKLCVTEDFLIDECIELDKARKWENPSEPNKWIKLALPHLRILSLPANTRLNFDLSRLRKFLTPKEQRVLAQRMLFGGKSRLDPAKLCSITEPRDRCAYHFKRFTNYMKNN